MLKIIQNKSPDKQQGDTSGSLNMTSGNLLGSLIRFAVPLMIIGVLQLLFNTIDTILLGQYESYQAMAAVGATSYLVKLIVNTIMGLTIGTTVLIARYCGESEYEKVSEVIHTSVSLAIVCGIAVAILGFVVATPLLTLLDTPKELLENASLYVRIYFIGIPVYLLSNIGGAALRAVGDCSRPLLYLIISVFVKAGFSLLLVVVFKMGVAGAAIATIISYVVSAWLVVRYLVICQLPIKLTLRKLRITASSAKDIFKISVPSGMQAMLFSLSNLVIQSTINSFGAIVIAGHSAAANIEGFIFIAMDAFNQTDMTFASQNMGAKKYDRVKSVLKICLGIVIVVGISLGMLCYMFAPELLRLYSSDAQVIQAGVICMQIMCTTYFLVGLSNVVVGHLRGIGYSAVPMIVTLLGASGLRILYVYTVFPLYGTPTALYIGYPISWTATMLMNYICYRILWKRTLAEHGCLE